MAAPSFYLGPDHVDRALDSWEQVEIAAAAGVLAENQWVELKQDVPATSKGANRELAKDLASLSIDGGVLIIGVADQATADGAVTGVAPAGLHSRISQVAATLVVPPLSLTIAEIPHPDQDERAVIVVTVPASPEAPHMVENSYWGRSAEGKRKLSDPEVRRLMTARAASAAGFEKRLRAVALLDAEEVVAEPRLYLLIEPAIASAQPMTQLLRETSLQQVAATSLTFNPPHGPSLADLSHHLPHARGLAAATLGNAALSADHRMAEHYLFLLLDTAGAVHLCGPAAHPPSTEDTVTGWVWVAHVLQNAHSALQLAAYLAQTYTGYQGTWRVGVTATSLRGTKAAVLSESWIMRTSAYQEQDYQRTTTATTAQLRESAPDLVATLTGDLLRGLSVERRYLPYSEVNDLWRAEQSRSM